MLTVTLANRSQQTTGRIDSLGAEDWFVELLRRNQKAASLPSPLVLFF